MDDFQCCLLHDGTLKGCPVRFTWLWQTGHSSSNMQLSPKTILKGIKSFGETIADRIQWFFGFKAHFPGRSNQIHDQNSSFSFSKLLKQSLTLEFHSS